MFLLSSRVGIELIPFKNWFALGFSCSRQADVTCHGLHYLVPPESQKQQSYDNITPCPIYIIAAHNPPPPPIFVGLPCIPQYLQHRFHDVMPRAPHVIERSAVVMIYKRQDYLTPLAEYRSSNEFNHPAFFVHCRCTLLG